MLAGRGNTLWITWIAAVLIRDIVWRGRQSHPLEAGGDLDSSVEALQTHSLVEGERDLEKTSHPASQLQGVTPTATP